MTSDDAGGLLFVVVTCGRGVICSPEVGHGAITTGKTQIWTLWTLNEGNEVIPSSFITAQLWNGGL